MLELVLIVEGHGDVAAFPNLVGKVGAWLELPLYCAKPIRARGWSSIKKSGGLEGFVALAASRNGCRRVIIVVDLDDDCPVIERASISARVEALEQLHNVEICVCFCMREFEAWLLAIVPELAMEGLIKGEEIRPVDACETIRDAKGKLRSLLVDGYSEATDQADIVRYLQPATLYRRDRSFRTFVKALAKSDYPELDGRAAA